MDRDQTDALKLISAHRAQIAEYAKRGHAAMARGVVRIKLPELSPYGETLIATTEMVYYTLDLVCHMAATIADLDGVVRMMEAYGSNV